MKNWGFLGFISSLVWFAHSLPTPLAPQGSFRERRERNGTEERVGRDTKGTKEPQY